MFETFALGMAQIANPDLFRLERRKAQSAHAQVVQRSTPLVVPNLNHSLIVLRVAAWQALDQVKQHVE